MNFSLQETPPFGPARRAGRRPLAAMALGAALIGFAAGTPAAGLNRPVPAAGLPGRGGAVALLSAAISGSFAPRSRTWRIDVTDLPLAGGRVRIAGVLRPGGWSLEAHATAVDLAEAARIARQWVSLPPGYRISGHADLDVALTGRGASQRLRLETHSSDLSLANQSGTIVAQQVAAALSGILVRHGDTVTAVTRVQASGGQLLAGAALLDFAANPLTLAATLDRSGKGPVVVSRLDLEQRDLIRAHAEGVVRPGAHPGIVRARVVMARLQFPAAYKSYLQLALATTALGSLQSTGEAAGSIDIANDAVTRLDCSLHDINFTDPEARVLVQHANGDIHWVSAPGAAVAPSDVAWQHAAAYDLSGGPVRLRFVTWQRNFALLGGNSRLPVFDGAVIVHTLVGRDLGTSQAKIDFDADVTPISMPRLSKALGWPVMNGDVSGHIPLVRYRNRELTFDGDLIAKVFDGTITGSKIVLKNPLGPWPSLSADVLARGLDLDLVTHTFAFGSITGRIDVDVRGLQLFDWSPVAFDARLYTMPGDRSPHRVSQNAVTRIAGLGGAAGAVKAALESGVLKFFHTFHYDRIGIGCRLRNEVCGMSGAGAAPDGGYYLIRGSGVPRLDIIGNVRRVDWPRLIGQIGEGMREGDFVVHTGRK
ncbi:MAG: hypothetical protein KGL45_03710 [Gammaproteobacteria bacterium]|nr:hypothetical protein [Gammaproteobacteria bacterium]